MKTSPEPDIYGLKPETISLYVSPAYSAGVGEIMPKPGTEHRRFLFQLYVIQAKPTQLDDSCFDVVSEIAEGSLQPVLSIFDETGHHILKEEKGDWANAQVFAKRALELAGERFGTTFIDFDRRWRYGSVLASDTEALDARIKEGGIVVSSSNSADGSKWILLKRAKSPAPPIPVT